jgi:hypothetical protein
LQEQFPGRKMVDLSAADQAKVRAAALQEETARLGAKSKLQVQRESAIDQANQIRAAKGLEPMPGGSAPQSPAEFIGAAQEAISPEEALLQKWYDTEQVRRAATGQPLLKPLPWAQPRQ